MSDATPPETAPDDAASDAEAPAPADVEPDEDDDAYKSRILIKPNGEVVIENLSMDLMELAMALDPDSEVACEIGELLGPSDPSGPPGE